MCFIIHAPLTFTLIRKIFQIGRRQGCSNLPAYISPTCSRTPPSRRACSWQGQGRSTLSTSMSTPWQCASVFGCHRLGPERTFGSYGIHGNGISTFRRKPFSRGACLSACLLCLCRRHCSPPLSAAPGCRPSAADCGGRSAFLQHKENITKHTQRLIKRWVGNHKHKRKRERERERVLRASIIFCCLGVRSSGLVAAALEATAPQAIPITTQHSKCVTRLHTR